MCFVFVHLYLTTSGKKCKLEKSVRMSLCLPNTVLSLFLWVFLTYSELTSDEVRKGTRAVHGWYLESF